MTEKYINAYAVINKFSELMIHIYSPEFAIAIKEAEMSNGCDVICVEKVATIGDCLNISFYLGGKDGAFIRSFIFCSRTLQNYLDTGKLLDS